MNSKTEKLNPLFKINGNKKYLSKYIINNLPEITGKEEYIEPFCGTASVLLHKNKSQLEVINDLDPGIIAIFRAIRDECALFVKKLKKIEYKKESFDKALIKVEFDNNINYAINEFTLRRMSCGGMKKNFSLSEKLREMNDHWLTTIEELPIISKRIKNCFIFNKPAVDVIKAFNHENTICYVDPPNLQESKTSNDKYEMNTDDHIELSKVLIDFKGKVLISGHYSTLYKRLYKEWKCIKKVVSKDKSKTECIWMNY